MLEFDDIQHILLTRTPAITGRYEFLSFDTPAGGRAWLSELLDKVQSAADAQATMDGSDRWVTLAFTWNGLRALGVPEESLATFPDEFREGMAARADILGDTGTAAPEHWVGGLAGDDVHAIAILFSRTDEQCRRSIAEHDKLLARTDGVRSVSYLDLNATPPFNYAHDHFGFRDRLSQPVMKGSGEEPTPGSGAALEPGEFILGYPDEDGPVANLPEPEVLSRNGSYMAYRRLQEHVGRLPRLPARAMPTPRRIRNCWPRSSWAAGAAAHRWCWRRTPTIPNWAQIRCATTTSTTRRWTRSATRARWDRMHGGSIRATPRTT